MRVALESRLLDRIVEMAEKCVKETGIANSPMEESQLHNLLNIANATDSIKAIENFICYQMGRRRSEWRSEFGNRVLEDLKELATMAQQEKVKHIDFVRLYVGFLFRWFVAERR